MNKLAPHQERVLTEKKDLDTKIQKLQEFLLSEKIVEVDHLEADRMQRQLDAMNGYSRVLDERIAAWSADENEGPGEGNDD